MEMRVHHPNLEKHDHYLKFLNAVVRERYPDRKEIPFSEISEVCGFKSRAHLREILIGERKVSKRSLEKLCKGLEIHGRLRRLLEMLVALDDPRRFDLEKSDIEEAITNLQKSLAFDQTESEGTLYDRQLAKIFTCLTHSSPGLTMNGLRRSTRLSRLEIRELLTYLVRHGFVEHMVSETGSDIYRATQKHWISRAQSNNEGFVDAMEAEYLWCVKSLKAHSTSRKHLFLASSVSIDKSRLTEFKEKFREMCLDFAESIESDTDTDTLKLVVALGPE